MTDLISRADATAYPLSWEHYDKENGSREFICGVESYREYIDALPSADAVSREQYDTVCNEYNRLVHNSICKKLCNENCEYEKGNTCYHAREHYAIDSVLPADTVQGEWIVREYCTNELDYRRWIEIECPFCGERPTYEDLDNMNYCPNCGAKMKGGAE